MVIDIFDFWSHVAPDAHEHPDDRAVLDRVPKHGFNLKLLPGCFMGPLRTAPVVLLFLSPGQSDDDEPTPALKIWHAENRAGNEPLISAETHKSAHHWWTQRTKCFGESQEVISRNVAVLNIGAYHSKDFTDHGLLAALPSSRVALDWAQSVLFPQAEAGERVVICLRAARYWGLESGQLYKGGLFAPKVTRGGHMLKSDSGPVISAVRRTLNLS